MIKIKERVTTVKDAFVHCDNCDKFLYKAIIRGDDHITKSTKYERHIYLENHVFESELCEKCFKDCIREINTTLTKYKFKLGN